MLSDLGLELLRCTKRIHLRTAKGHGSWTSNGRIGYHGPMAQPGSCRWLPISPTRIKLWFCGKITWKYVATAFGLWHVWPRAEVSRAKTGPGSGCQANPCKATSPFCPQKSSWNSCYPARGHIVGTLTQKVRLNMSQNVSKCLKMSQNVSKCLKMSQNVSKCLKMSQT